MVKKVAIIMGSESDLPSMQGAIDVLLEFGIPLTVKIVSAHRTPEQMFRFAKQAEKIGFAIIIAGAGGAAHLPGMVASLTTLPVIGVPVTIGKLKGLDALLSIAQMPRGVPVATVAVDNSYNAGVLAARILGVSDKKLNKKLIAFQSVQRNKVSKMNKNLSRNLKDIDVPKRRK